MKVVQRVPVKIVFDKAVDQSKYHLAPGMSVVPTVKVGRADEEDKQAEHVADEAHHDEMASKP